MSERYVLYGSGTTGRWIARDLRAKGISALCFVDSNQEKHGQVMEEIEVIAPSVAKLLYPDAIWLATSIIPEFHEQIVKAIAQLRVKTMPVWGFLPQRNTPPTRKVFEELLRLADDPVSINFLWDQWHMRNDPEHYEQCPPDDIKEIYWPGFISHRDDEHYVDCGAADGDTVREFLNRWPKFAMINALEPDEQNFDKLCGSILAKPGQRIYCIPTAVGDVSQEVHFAATGDYSAHLDGGGTETVGCAKLDDMFFDFPPTYIKMDIESSEPAALWGARRILLEHSPVLAVCAYHEASHFWTLPLLLHALQPAYQLFYRRYAAGSFEQVWYAVPPERIK